MKKILTILMLLTAALQLGAQQKQWAVVNVSSCFMRAQPDYESGNETQCLMGTVLEVSGSDRYWLRVSAPDYRNCWTNELSLALMDEAEKDAYIAAPKLICTAEYTVSDQTAFITAKRHCISQRLLCVRRSHGKYHDLPFCLLLQHKRRLNGI